MRRAFLAACALVALAGTLLSGVTQAAPVTPRTSPVTGWQTIIDDTFDTPGIPAHWGLYNGPYGSAPHNCAAPSQDSAPGDGSLYLSMSYLPSGKCGAGWYTGGMQLSSAYTYREQAITVRWRLLPSTAPSVVYAHYVLPMLWPQDPNYAWYQGELDYCEGEATTGCTSFLHYAQNQQISHPYTVDLTQWHTWSFEQQNGTLLVSLDGAPVWSFAGGTAQLGEILRRAVLQQECPHAGCPPASAAGAEARIQIDEVRVAIPVSATPTSTLTPIATATVTPSSTPAPIVTPVVTPVVSPTPTGWRHRHRRRRWNDGDDD